MSSTHPPIANQTRKLPRRRPTNSTASFYFKMIGVMASGALGAYLVFVFIMKVLHPYQMGFAVERQITEARAELHEQTTKNRELERRVAYLKTPEGAETEARRAGFARPGEIIYLLKPRKSEK